MVGSLITRGLLVGLLAGVLAFGFARFMGEPQVDRAIAFEAQLDAAKGEPPEEELVSRPTQAGIGLATGVLVYGTAIGGLFALIFAFLQGRVGRIGPRELSAVLALLGFLAIVFVPQLKYPANPPSVGDPDTIGHRTALFFVMIAVSIAAMAAAANLALRLKDGLGRWNATIVAGLAFIVFIAIVQTLLPDVNEVPQDFPAVVLWRFRASSLGIQAILWTVIGLGYGWLTERDQQKRFGVARAIRRA